MASHSVDTTTSVLQLHVVFHIDDLEQIMRDRVIRPCNVMAKSEHGSWVVLHTTIGAAVDRARWVFGEAQLNTGELILIGFEFTALGIGHYTFTYELTTRDWKLFLFHGNLPFQCSNFQDRPFLRRNYP